jgi:CHAD domain-containing protein
VRFGKLVQSWRGSLTAVSPLSAGELAADRIRRAHVRVVKRGSAIVASSPAEALHDLRKRCKELRYLLEFFASLHDPKIHRGLVKDLKGLQDCLGEFQDGQVQADAIRTFAADMMAAGQAPAATLLAMGELTARLEQGQHHAREEFAGRFARFASAQNTDRVKALLSGSST